MKSKSETWLWKCNLWHSLNQRNFLFVYLLPIYYIYKHVSEHGHTTGHVRKSEDSVWSQLSFPRLLRQGPLPHFVLCSRLTGPKAFRQFSRLCLPSKPKSLRITHVYPFIQIFLAGFWGLTEFSWQACVAETFTQTCHTLWHMPKEL